jgi:hypothetical protein
MKRKQLHDCSHLTLEQRKIIQVGIENGSTKADIARTIVERHFASRLEQQITICFFWVHASN